MTPKERNIKSCFRDIIALLILKLTLWSELKIQIMYKMAIRDLNSVERP
jgi:hypothetical protein